MTESDLLALPERERDALVEVTFFGTDLSENPQHEWEELDPDLAEAYQSSCSCVRCGCTPGWLNSKERDHYAPGPCVRRPRDFSLIAAAWQVVERADGFDMRYNQFFEKYNAPGPWYADITYFPTGDYVPEENRYVGEGFGYAYADTAPLAICLAALKAKGVVE